jgi:C1A family cysteine protease
MNKIALSILFWIGTFAFIKAQEPNFSIYQDNLPKSAAVQAKLSQLRQTIQVKKLDFEVAPNKNITVDKKKILGVKMNKAKTVYRNAAMLQTQTALNDEADTLLRLPTFTLYNMPIYQTTYIRDQYNCNSCFVHSILAAFESNFRKTHGFVDDLSEQDVVDCFENTQGNTCASGGDPNELLDWLQKTQKPLQLESDKVYEGSTATCMGNSNTIYTVESWGLVDKSKDWRKIPSVTEIKQALIQYGALSSTIYATDLFIAYSKGTFSEIPSGDPSIFEPSNDGTYGTPVVNHAITIVGWDDNRKAWLVKNSWGYNWGGNGVAYVAYNTNNIGVSTNWVKAKAVTITEPKVALQPFHLVIPQKGSTFNKQYPNAIALLSFYVDFKNLPGKNKSIIDFTYIDGQTRVKAQYYGKGQVNVPFIVPSLTNSKYGGTLKIQFELAELPKNRVGTVEATVNGKTFVFHFLNPTQ